MDRQRKIQILGILLLAFSLMFLISLGGHAVNDDMQITSDEAVYGNPFKLTYANPGGMMGAYFSYVAFFFLGWGAYLMVIFLTILSVKIVGFDLGRRLFKHAALWWGTGSVLLALFDISAVSSGHHYVFDIPNGAGALGQTLIDIIIKLIGMPGAYILFLALLLSLLIYYFSISHRFRNAVTGIYNYGYRYLEEIIKRLAPKLDTFRGRINLGRISMMIRPKFKDELKRILHGKNDSEHSEAIENVNQQPTEVTEDKIIYESKDKDRPVSDKRKVVMPRRQSEVSETRETGPASAAESKASADDFSMPGADLLNENRQTGHPLDQKELANTAKALRDTLETFGVTLDGNIEMFPGPIITRFEIRPGAGIKVNQVANLSDDLALNLRAKSIRIVAPVPGKAAVGIEIPNRNPDMVFLRDIIYSEEFQNNRYELPIALGKDSAGNPFIADLSRMPHLLVAGTTGSGKSVCINAVVTSLIYSLHPNHLRFIFIDPKMLELSVYKGIPYLDEDVVTNAKQAERVLNDAVSEMESRYRMLASASVRSIVDYNKKQKQANEKLPYIIIVIDELADLMMSTHSSRVELLITRLAQMARAVGIHLILATQRPSVDVITGLIKANFPSRIAFQVATRTDSRTILDGNGAERLLGAGDMLFLEAGKAEPVRVHGAYITSEETERLVAFLKDQPFSQKRVDEAKVAAEEKSQMRQFNDPVLLEAIETVIRQGQASVSLLQRKLGVGYQRAARIIDELEEMKIVGGYNESKAREVLVDRNFLNNLRAGKFSKT